jgi:hypothetical protein
MYQFAVLYASDPATEVDKWIALNIKAARGLLLRVHSFSSRLNQQKIAHASLTCF